MTATAFDLFSEACERFWDAQGKGRPSAAAGSIAVDLMHDNVWYLRLNLHLAKILQRRTGARIVGIMHDWAPPLVEYRPDVNRRLAAAHGVDEIIDLDDVGADAPPHPDDEAAIRALRAALQAARGLTGGALRAALFDLGDDPDFGWLAYDTVIRTKQTPTLERLDEEACAQFERLLRETLLLRRACETHDVRQSVCGHIEYHPYAALAQSVIDRGGEAFFLWPLVPGTVRRFTDRESLRHNRDRDFLTLYEDEVRSRYDPALPGVAAFAAAFRARLSATRAYTKSNQQADARLDRQAFHDLYGLDARKPTACILSQALSDAVHANGAMLFDDFGQWLVQALDAAVEGGDANLVLKVHPRDRVYNVDGFVAELIRRYDACPNVAILPSAVQNAEIVAHAQTVTTVHGTPGYELAIDGASTVIAGRARYSGLGIASEPSDPQRYLDELFCRTPSETRAPDAGERAMTFAFAEFCLFRAPCLFVRYDVTRPPLNAPYWREQAFVYGTLSLQDDPFFLAVERMLHYETPILLRNGAFGG